jgi:hypothetical protein
MLPRSMFALALCLAARTAHAQAPAPVNLAAGKPATQSSTHEGGVASRAVDGITDGEWNKGSVTHTQIDTPQPWWQVDLQSVQEVGTVTLYNRTDPCCIARLASFNIRVSADGTTWHHYPVPYQVGAKATIPINRAARYVKVQLTGPGTLNLAEVVVSPLENLARGKPATQNATDGSAVATRAVDGNLDGNFNNGSVTMTAPDKTVTKSVLQWWQVDLGAAKAIGEVLLHNRTDCCGEKLNNFTVRVSANGTNWQDYPYVGPAGQVAAVVVQQVARYVRVRLNKSGTLSLAEVQVTPGRNLAKGKPATQSSTNGKAVAARAVDGMTAGNFSQLSVTHTLPDTAQPWWQVDLQSVESVGSLSIHNRTDCCGDRLTNFKVLTSADGTTWREYLHTGTAGVRTIVPINAPTRYVKIQLVGTGTLSLAEVQVFEAVSTAQASPLPCGSKVQVKSHKGDYLHRSETTLTTWTGGPGIPGNVWILECEAPNLVYLKSWTGDYLHRPDNVNPIAMTWSTRQPWTVERNGEYVRIKSWKNDYLYRPSSPQGIQTGPVMPGFVDWTLEAVR